MSAGDEAGVFLEINGYVDLLQSQFNHCANVQTIEEMLRDSASSKTDEASLSQPLCTALQVALVELLRSWGVKPVAVVGRFSGEIAAAYCAGMLSPEAAMQAAYYRGKYAMELDGNQRANRGAMMAVGFSQDEVQPLLTAVKSGRLVTACVNSPVSVTISGDKEAMEELQTILQDRGVFNRMLRVKVAYHSHHMKPIVQKYAESLASIDAKPAKPEVKFKSSVFPMESLFGGTQVPTQANILPRKPIGRRSSYNVFRCYVVLQQSAARCWIHFFCLSKVIERSNCMLLT
ncbi:MAG: hypothetical protein Q9209_007829 [Squamulea sp. 1 TL-2023]